MNSIAGNQYNPGKFGRVTVHSADGQWRELVYWGLGSSAILSWMFTPYFDAIGQQHQKQKQNKQQTNKQTNKQKNKKPFGEMII